ncbi:S-layer protein (TIGR01567 family) [Methanohalophilus levihalophilus]|uniref:S-layer protein domain-containing protein n=1 Tax=Methanohalophilus levihalophilus TaxID=1431282 RepID=UPI001FD9B734|nr:S-layer protein domain-containing protein [Methanohalophilus levihalophilus]MBP2030504.1 S-layer protein (TIGR01567 family) [Methanohalophilus levihalophilus]
MSLALVSGICSADSVEVRGNILDSGNNASAIVWDGLNWSVLYFSLNDAGSNTEILYYLNIDTENPAIGAAPDNNIIDEKELIYSTHSYSKKFKLSAKTDATAVNTYSVIPWFGKKYIVVDDDAGKMATLITEQGGDAEKDLKEGESWNLGQGYSLKLDQLDVDAGKVFVILYKDEEELESVVLDMEGNDDDRAFIAKDDFAGSEDVVYFVTYLDNTFRSTSDSFAIFKYTWLIDKDNIKIIEKGDEFGLFECREVSESWINMSNSKRITLEINDKTYFTDDWYFKTSKAGKGSNGGYLFYPAMNIVFETEEADVVVSSENDVNVANETASQGDTTLTEESSAPLPSATSSEEDNVQTLVTEETAAEKQNLASIPGFLSLTATSGLLITFFILKRRTD